MYNTLLAVTSFFLFSFSQTDKAQDFFIEKNGLENLRAEGIALLNSDGIPSDDEMLFSAEDLLKESEEQLKADEESLFSSDENLLDKLENPELGPQSEGAVNSEEKFIPEKIIRNRNNGLRTFEYGDEFLGIVKLKNGKGVITVNSEGFCQKTYNQDNQLTEKIFWHNDTSDNPYRKINFIYSEEGILTSTFENNYSDKTEIENSFNEKGKCVKISKWKTDENNKSINSVQKFSYDEQNRIVLKSKIEYTEEINPVVKVTQKYIYNYIENIDEPDEDFYENNELRISIRHQDENKKTAAYYFDSGFSMIVTYENGIKISEKAMFNGNEI